MKKLCIVIAAALLTAVMLCGCGAGEEEIKQKLKDNGYSIVTLEEEPAALGVESDKVEYMFQGQKQSDTQRVVYVIAFKEGDAATELYNSQNNRSGESKVVKKGNVVIFGDPDGVQLFNKGIAG